MSYSSEVSRIIWAADHQRRPVHLVALVRATETSAETVDAIAAADKLGVEINIGKYCAKVVAEAVVRNSRISLETRKKFEIWA
jgi:hypothetical protein